LGGYFTEDLTGLADEWFFANIFRFAWSFTYQEKVGVLVGVLWREDYFVIA